MFCELRNRDTSPASSLTRNGTPGIGGELARPHHQQGRRSRDHEYPGTDEPAEIGEGEKECALAPVEVPAGGGEEAGGPHYMSGGLGGISVRRQRSCAEQDRHVVEQPIRP